MVVTVELDVPQGSLEEVVALLLPLCQEVRILAAVPVESDRAKPLTRFPRPPRRATCIDWMYFALQEGELVGGFTLKEISRVLERLGWAGGGNSPSTIRSAVLRALGDGLPWISFDGKKSSRSHIYEFQLPEASGAE